MAEPWEMYQQQGAQPTAPPPAMPDASAAPDATPPAQPTDNSGVEPWQLYQQQAAPDTSQAARQPNTPAATTPTGNTDQLPSISDAIHSYIQGVRERVGASPSEFGHNVVSRLSGLAAGANLNINRSVLTIGKLARDIDKAHGIYPNGHPLDSEIADWEAMMNREADKRQAMNPAAKSGIQPGDDMTNVLQYMAGEAAVKALPLITMLEQFGPVKAALQKAPLAAKVLRTMIEQGITGGGQELVQGGEPGDVVKAGLVSSVIGSLGELGDARMARLANLADTLEPTMQNIRGVNFRTLQSEATSEHGQNIATPAQRSAADISEQPEIQAERQAGFKDLQTNLAQQATANVLNDANTLRTTTATRPPITGAEITAPDFDYTTPEGQSLTPEQAQEHLGNLKTELLSDTITPDREQDLMNQYTDLRDKLQAKPPAWSYVAPSGKSFSPDEARAALRELQQQWLERDWNPDDNQKFQDAYNDLKGQLDRHEQFSFTQPHLPPHDVPGVVGSIRSYGDAADYFNQSARQAVQRLGPEAASDYSDLNNRRNVLQNTITRAQGNPEMQSAAMDELNSVNQKMEALFKQPAVGTRISDAELQQGLKEQRLANGFQMLQNVMDRHFTYRAGTAQDINAPRVARNLPQLADNIEAVKARYGDVLDPAIGDKGLNHILDMGKYMNMPEGAERVNSLMGNMAHIIRKYYSGMRGTVAGSALGAGLLAHMATHIMGGGLATTGAILGAEARAAYTKNRIATDPAFVRQIRNRIAADPAFSSRFLFGARSLPAHVAAPLLASGMLAWMHRANSVEDDPEATGAANATSQPNR